MASAGNLTAHKVSKAGVNDEAAFITGHFHLVAYTLNSLGVKIESDSEGAD